MKKDINIPEAAGIHIIIGQDKEGGWKVYLLNKNNHPIDKALVVTKGYGKVNGEEVKTSILRHYLGKVASNDSVEIERIDPDTFHINHEFWLTYYVNNQIYDKKFLFTNHFLSDKNLSYIEELELEGFKK